MCIRGFVMWYTHNSGPYSPIPSSAIMLAEQLEQCTGTSCERARRLISDSTHTDRPTDAKSLSRPEVTRYNHDTIAMLAVTANQSVASGTRFASPLSLSLSTSVSLFLYLLCACVCVCMCVSGCLPPGLNDTICFWGLYFLSVNGGAMCVCVLYGVCMYVRCACIPCAN